SSGHYLRGRPGSRRPGQGPGTRRPALPDPAQGRHPQPAPSASALNPPATAASAITAAAASLTKVLLRALLNIDSFVAVATSFSGPREVTDTVAATVLGIMGLLVVLPAALAVNNR